jgi:tetratricopeptide (TPR) repeat protein
MSTVSAKPSSAPSPQECFREASVLHQSGKFHEAEALLKDAVGKYPDNSDLWNVRGVILAALRRHIDAIWCYRLALTLTPNASSVWTNLGNALVVLKQPKSAIVCHERAIALSQTKDPLLYHNLGAALCGAKQYGKAANAFARALAINPDFHLARWDLALSNLYLGNLEEGWSNYEVRLISGQVPKRILPGKKWDGAPYQSKRLVLLAEQGFGDALWVARYFRQVKALGGELIIECRRELIPLIASMGIADRVIRRGEAAEADFYCYLCSLPGLFTKDIGSIPDKPYVCAPPDRIAKFRRIIGQAPGRLKVGIVWAGSVTFGNNRDRAHALMRFVQSFALPGVQLYSLQKGPPERELAALPKGSPVIDLSPHLLDFADTAAAVDQLDLVIMTDSAVAHLSGAMGKPVWVLLGATPHWLWLTDRSDSPWYPTMRLFRSRGGRDWDDVFDIASVALMELAASMAPKRLAQSNGLRPDEQPSTNSESRH